MMTTAIRPVSCSHPSAGRISARPAPHVQRQRCTALASADTGGSTKTAWYDKNKELWRELTTEEDFTAAQESLLPGQLLFVDYYAGWCAVCKGAYPGLCRIVGDPALRKGQYLFAKASLDHAPVKARIKREGISGIPWICIYARDGSKVAGFGSAFKRLEMVRTNLHFVADHLDRLRDIRTDPNGFLIIPGTSPDAQRSTATAATVTVTATTSSSSQVAAVPSSLGTLGPTTRPDDSSISSSTSSGEEDAPQARDF